MDHHTHLAHKSSARTERVNAMSPLYTIGLGFSVAHFVPFSLLFLFWRRRNKTPIRYRQPKVILIAIMFGQAWSLYISISALDFPWTYAERAIIQYSLLSCFIDTFTAFGFATFIAFSRTLQQAQFSASLGKDPERLAAAVLSDSRARFLMSGRFAVFFVVTSCLILLVVQVALLLQRPALFTMRALSAYSDRSSGALMVGVFSNYKISVSCLFFLVSAYSLRITADNFGIKASMKRISALFIIGYVVYFISAAFMPVERLSYMNFFYVIMVQLISIEAAFGPLLLSYRSEDRQIFLAAAASSTSQFERFLLTKKGLDQFQKHLIRERAVENLLFWTDATQFKSRFQNRTVEENANWADTMYATYLAPDSMMEANLDAETLQYFRTLLFPKGMISTDHLEPNIFQEASDRLLELMKYDSLMRFCRQNPESWQEFLSLDHEVRCMSQVHASDRVDRQDDLAIRFE
uniref:RGS domain-containing protein n=1 Tax=Spongospora subterranea TaxID=70186 RepID=A0A0H5QIQ7_9EUKA|eukprot:CRZ01532.1 hypothetical protein [Spongospora subterranea]